MIETEVEEKRRKQSQAWPLIFIAFGVAAVAIIVAVTLFLCNRLWLTPDVATQEQSVLLNGGFELPGFSAPPYIRYMADGDITTLTGWTVIDDGIGQQPYVAHLGTPDYDVNVVRQGVYGVVLTQGSGLRTTVPVVSNTLYALSFWLDEGGRYGLPPLAVTVAGSITNIAAARPTPDSPHWRFHLFRFTAQSTDPAATLEFFNPSPVSDRGGWAIDGVTVVSVPGIFGGSKSAVLAALIAALSALAGGTLFVVERIRRRKPGGGAPPLLRQND